MRKIFTAISAAAGFLSLASTKVFAQAVGAVQQTGIPFTDLGILIRNILAVLFFAAGLAAFVFLIIGGIQYITAGGDPKAAASARDRITGAIVGLIIVVAAFAIVLILERVFGIRIVSGVVFPASQGQSGT